MIDELNIAIDMGGCPNHCKHCHLGTSKKTNLSIDDFDLVYELFANHTEKLAIYSFYKEPDYLNNYQELYELERKLSNNNFYQRKERISIYRLNHDEHYLEWIKKIGIKQIELTLFGLERNTNNFTRRTNYYQETIKAINLLLENNIIPRIKIIINKNNINEQSKLLNNLKEINRNEEIIVYGVNPKPTGEGLKYMHERITKKDLKLIPNELFDTSSKYMHTNNPFGLVESELYQKYQENEGHINLKQKPLTLYIDYKFDVYPNILSMAPYLKLGNIKENTVTEIIENYEQDLVYAFKIAKEVKIKDLVREFGNQQGIWLFNEEDYLPYLLELYCKKYYQK